MLQAEAGNEPSPTELRDGASGGRLGVAQKQDRDKPTGGTQGRAH